MVKNDRGRKESTKGQRQIKKVSGGKVEILRESEGDW